MGLISGLGSCPGGEHGNPLKYSFMDNSKDRGAWWAMVYWATKSWKWLSTRYYFSTKYWRMEAWIAKNMDVFDYTKADIKFQSHCRWWLQPWNWKMLAPRKKSYDKPRQRIKKQRHYFANKGPPSKSYGFSSSQVWMWELDHKESWAPKNWCFCTVVLEKTLKNPLDFKEIQPVNPKGNQSWIFIGRTDAEAEAPILWPPDVKSRLTGKDPGNDWRLEEKGMTEDEMVGWHHWLSRHECNQALGVGDGEGRLASCSPWGHK